MFHKNNNLVIYLTIQTNIYRYTARAKIRVVSCLIIVYNPTAEVDVR